MSLCFNRRKKPRPSGNRLWGPLFLLISSWSLHAQQRLEPDYTAFASLENLLALPLPDRPVLSPPLSRNEDAVAPAGGDVAGAETAFATLQGVVLDRRNHDTLEKVALEIILLDGNGEMARVYTGLAARGNFSIPLMRDASQILILRKPGYEPQAVLLEQQPDQEDNVFYLDARTEWAEVLSGLPPLRFSVLHALTVPAPSVLPDEVLAALAPVPTPAPEPDEPAETIASANDRPAVEEEVLPVVIGRFQLTEATSLRAQATHLSQVLLRFSPGDRVEVLEKTDRYWWRVRVGTRVGYVKALLLTEVE